MGEATWSFFFILIIVFAAGLTEILTRNNIIEKNSGRKILHIVAGFLVSFLPLFITGKMTLLIIGFSVLIVLYYLVSRNKLSGIDDLERKSWGIVYFPVSFIILIILFLPQKPEIFTLSFLLMTFSDSFASIIGKKIKSREFHLTRDKKSIAGSVSFFAVSVLILTVFLFFINGKTSFTDNPLFFISFVIVIASITTLLEAIASGGFDNFTVPIGAAFLVNIFLYNSASGTEITLFAGFVASLLVGILSFKLRFLTKDGAAGAIILGTFVYGFGGVKWTFPVMTFFILSSILSKIRTNRNKEVEERFEKSGNRNLGQVLANGGLGGLILITESYLQTGWLYFLFVLNFAAVCSDTWGTEFGTMWRTRTISVRNFRTVPQGLSGGISFPGTIGALVGALMVVISSYYWIPDFFIFVNLVVLGFGGSVVDSLLGEFLQIQFKCKECGIITERKHHCDLPTSQHKGFHFITNDIVNFGSAIVSILVFIIIYKAWL